MISLDRRQATTPPTFIQDGEDPSEQVQLLGNTAHSGDGQDGAARPVGSHQLCRSGEKNVGGAEQQIHKRGST